MALSIAELARMAGTSRTSVSLVLNGKAQGKISRETQEQINRLVAAHGCRPDAAARRLRSRRTMTIGTIMLSPRNTFYAQQVAELQRHLASRGYMALFSFWKTAEEIPQAFDAVCRHGVDGVIAYDYHPCLCYETLPIMLFAPELHENFDMTQIDQVATATQALQHLTKLGHRKIAYVGNFYGPRLPAYLQYLRNAGLPVHQEYQQQCMGYPDEGAQAMQRILAFGDPPTAVICHDDETAIGVISALNSAGLAVPGDVSVIGTGNALQSQFLNPPLTTFECHGNDMALYMVQRLLQRIEEPELPVAARYFSPDLIVRASTAIVKSY